MRGRADPLLIHGCDFITITIRDSGAAEFQSGSEKLVFNREALGQQSEPRYFLVVGEMRCCLLDFTGDEAAHLPCGEQVRIGAARKTALAGELLDGGFLRDYESRYALLIVTA